MNSFDVITIGNATIDAFLTIHDANVYCRINEKDCELCVRYGEKIRVDECIFQMGGNAANVAVGVARLGSKSSLVAEVGDDEFAQKILSSLKKETIDTTYLLQTPDTASSFAIGINFKAERTLFVKHAKRAHQFNIDAFSGTWVYLTSLGDEWKDVYHTVAQQVLEKRFRLAFAPGTYQLQEGVEYFRDVLQATEILFVNKEEGEKIAFSDQHLASNPDKNIKDLLVKLQELGPRIVVITDGENGSYALDTDGNIYQLCIVQTPIIERTGAGDAYAAGFLAAIVSGEKVSEAMRWGAINAASVISKVGAEAGLLTKEAMDKKLEEYKTLQAKII